MRRPNVPDLYGGTALGVLAVIIGLVTGLAIRSLRDIEGSSEVQDSRVAIAIYAVRHYQDHADEICDWLRKGDTEFTIFDRDQLVTMLLPQYFDQLPVDVEDHIRTLIERDCPEGR